MRRVRGLILCLPRPVVDWYEKRGAWVCFTVGTRGDGLLLVMMSIAEEFREGFIARYVCISRSRGLGEYLLD